MNTSNISKYVGVGLLSAAIGLNGGLLISDKLCDHTKEVCPLAKIENMLPITVNGYRGGLYHQTSHMIDDYKKQGIDAYCDFEEGMIPASKEDTEPRYFMLEDIEGNKVTKRTDDMRVFEKDGILWGEVDFPKKEVEGYIFTATYKDIDENTNLVETTKTLTLRK